MFSVIIPGRPCLTDIVAVDGQINPTKFAFSFPLLPHFSDLAIFYLPGTVLPQDTAAAIYIQFLPETDPIKAPTQPAAPPPEFKLLGALTNDEPSAIFDVRAFMPSSNSSLGGGGGGGGNAPKRSEADDEDEMLDEGSGSSNAGGSAPVVNGTVTLGISIEPIQTVAPQVAQLKAATAGKPSTDLIRHEPQQQRQHKEVSTKVLAQRIIGNAFNFLASFASSDQDLVPLKSFRDWWSKFERKIEMDPSFLEKEEPNV